MLTAQDMVDRLLFFIGEGPSGSTFSVRQAINEALREIAGWFNWSYLYSSSQITTEAPYSTGTIAFDYTGGTYERMLTLSSGTWPTWAAHGVFVYNSIAYRVAERISSTVITLESDSTPTADITAGASYVIYRQHYPLPTGFRSIGKIITPSTGLQLQRITPNQLREFHARNMTDTGQPRRYALHGEDDLLGGMALWLEPLPDDDYVLDFDYLRWPREVQIFSHTDGTVSLTSGSASITGSGTNWTSRMDGSVLRVSNSANASKVPSGLDGTNPYEQELRIAAVTSTTAARLYTAATTTISTAKYIISDPMDLDSVVLNPFIRCAEKQLAYTKKLDKIEAAEAAFQQAMQIGRASDNRTYANQRSGPYRSWRINTTDDDNV